MGRQRSPNNPFMISHVDPTQTTHPATTPHGGQPVTCLEWFFGYGGNHLGLKRAIPNLRLLAACEIEAYACANLVAKMEAGLLDPAPVWTDCKTFPLENFRGLVDIFIASYPCQGFSSAGKRQGQKDPRFLWPWVLRAIAIIQPRYCFFENVDGHVKNGLSTVLSDLEEAGYRHEAGIFSAAECGAPQQRKRVFILAQRKHATAFGAELANDNCSGHTHRQIEVDPTETGKHAQRDTGAGHQHELAHPARIGEREPHDETRTDSRSDSRKNISGRSREPGGDDSELSGRGQVEPPTVGLWSQCQPFWSNTFFWPTFVARPGQPQHRWEPPRVIQTQRGLGGGTNGRAANVDRLRLLGNGVYPATAHKAFLTLHDKLCKTNQPF
jgi:DNA (cytosine-5)-methyltransferase 1